MSDETNVQAEVPAGGGIIDLDAVEQVEVEKKEDGTTPESEGKAEQAEKASEEEAEHEGEEDGKEEKPKRRSGVQRLKAERDALRAENAELMRRFETSRPQQEDDEQPPKEDDFNGNWGEYIAATAAFKVRQDQKAEARKQATERAQAEQASVMRERRAAHNERVEAAREFIEDYDAVVKSASNIEIATEVGEEILASDKSELLAYHLARHPEQLRALNGMTGRQLAREIGRLEATVRAPSAKKQTSAPPPPSKVHGSAPPSNPDKDLDAWLEKKYGRK